MPRHNKRRNQGEMVKLLQLMDPSSWNCANTNCHNEIQVLDNYLVLKRRWADDHLKFCNMACLTQWVKER